MGYKEPERYYAWSDDDRDEVIQQVEAFPADEELTVFEERLLNRLEALELTLSKIADELGTINENRK